MPKEKINHPQPTEAAPGGDNGAQQAQTAGVVWVSWSRQCEQDPGHVQVTVSCEYDYVKNLVSADWNSDVLASSHALTRAEINKMIQMLRRARDQAHGRDV